MSTAWIFPGHGAQYAGMGRSLFMDTPHGRRWLVKAEAISGLELGVLAFGGRPHALKTPSVIEPLLAAVSGAYVDCLRAQGSTPAAVAGYSAGEVSAIYAAGVFDAETCLRIACKRGEILDTAAAKYPGGMVSLHGLPAADVVALVDGHGGGSVSVAAFHSSNQLTVAGEWTSLSVVVAEARAKGAKAVAVDVAGPWHTPLMNPVRAALAAALAIFPFAPAEVPVWTSATGTSSTDPTELRRALSDAVAAPVRWTAMVDGLLADGVDHFLEVGPGRSLWGLLGQRRAPPHFSRSFLERSGGDPVQRPYSRPSIGQHAVTMDRSLADRVALVTGASRGLGRAIALELARRGAEIVVNHKRNDVLADAVCAEIEAAGGRAMPMQADVTAPAEVQNMIRDTCRRCRRLDILVNNAGITRDNYFLMMSAEEWRELLDVNLNAVFCVTKAVIRTMAAHRYGVIINVGSGAALVAMPGQVNYSAAKAGLLGFSRSAARELVAKGVRMVNVVPGFFKTDMTEMLARDFVRQTLNVTPLGRWGRAEELAALVGFLASDAGAGFNGHSVVIDGGRGAQETEFGSA